MDQLTKHFCISVLPRTETKCRVLKFNFHQNLPCMNVIEPYFPVIGTDSKATCSIFSMVEIVTS